MPEMQAQIDSLRLAFSADVNRPFELKPTFPYGSPSEPYHPSPPPLDSQYQPHVSQVSGGVRGRVVYSVQKTGNELIKRDTILGSFELSLGTENVQLLR